MHMFKAVEFSEDDPLMRKKISELGEELAVLQRQLKDTDKSLLILISGWEVTGKGKILNDLLKELDPRYYRLHQFGKATPEDKRHPMFWRFFKAFPPHGEIAIFDHSFYRDFLHNPDISDIERIHAVRDIRFIEYLLNNDGCIVVKIFLNLTKDRMAENIKNLEKDENKHFFLSDFDYYQLKNYKKFLTHFERIINATSTLSCPWRIIEAQGNKKLTSKEVLITVIRSLEWHLNKPSHTSEIPLPPVIDQPLKHIDLTAAITPEYYHKVLHPLQQQAAELTYQLYMHNIPTIVAFEGTDASGKGGCIKRLTHDIDPRSYSVATTAAPTKYELSHHYLWRFYQTFPTPGHLTIYDRSWYGRVLVERVEGFAPVVRWQEAYGEINQMEQFLVDDGYVLMKFLLIIDKEEQLARFHERENTPSKNYKITDEDWRNHEKFDEYTQAMNDMVVRTSTIHAPWIIIPSMNKQYARVEVLKHFINTALYALNKKGIKVHLNKNVTDILTENKEITVPIKGRKVKES